MNIKKYRGERVYSNHYSGKRFPVVARFTDGKWRLEWTECNYPWQLNIQPELASAKLETTLARIEVTLINFRRTDELIEFEDECVYDGSNYRAKTVIRLREIGA